MCEAINTCLYLDLELCADALGKVSSILVLLFLRFALWAVNKVKAKKFSSGRLARVGVNDRRIEVEIQTLAPAGNLLLSECDFHSASRSCFIQTIVQGRHA